MKRAMAGLVLAGLLLVVCVLGAGGAFKAHAAEYDPAARVIRLNAEDVAQCESEGGCAVITQTAAAQGAHAIALLRQAGTVIQQLGAELQKARSASCPAPGTNLSRWQP